MSEDFECELRRASIAADAAKARHRAIVDSADDHAIIVTDLDGTITDWSKGAEILLGWIAEDVVGQPIGIIFTDEERAAGVPEDELRLAVQQGRGLDNRWHLRRGGDFFWASGRTSPLRDEAGQHVGYVKILRDQTAEHRAHERLETAEARLHQAQAAGGVGLFTVDIASDIMIPTPELCRLYGLPYKSRYPVSEFEARVLPEDRRVPSSLASRRSGEPPLDVEYRVRHPATGEVRWLSRTGTVEHADDGTTRFVGVVRDVTAQHDTLEALARSEQRYRALFEALEDGFCIIEFIDGPHGPFGDYVHVEANSGYERQSGIAGIVGRTLRDLEPEDAEGWSEIYGNVVRTGEPIRFERYFAAAGRHIEVSATRVEPPERRQVSVMFRDIEARRAIEADRDRTASALRVLNETLEQRVAERTAELMNAEAQLRQAQKMEAVGQLTGGLAHDFNNLLAGISGALEMVGTRLRQGRLPDVDKYLVAAQAASRRAASLTHRLLAFSRRQTLDPRPTDVNALVSGMTELIQSTVGPQIRVETVGAAGLWLTLVDDSQLENALLNLCINARDAMPHGGRITVETANKWLDRNGARTHDIPEGQYLSLCVTDTGVGMTPDVIAKAFDPFFTTKPIGQGTGLGLSMIYGFAKQSGGQVRIYSEVGEGTTVCIYLPRHYGEADVETAPEPRGSGGAAEAGETILVVDDEPSVRMLVTDVLEDLGYVVIEAADSASGLRVLQSDVRIDLLVSDVGLPGGMNGRQMADAARESRPDLRVLFITGYAENSVIGNGHLEPGMKVLTKPFVVETLAARVRDLMQD
ncbi:PAS domain S-box protein [Novosphingobium resinovorum]|uniref:PAS domain S-box protein n=1 Tax=Novosphingobium resinovorum TaxID=158500 RepID=UPI002ED4A799|nr:PAS domain S-box protein [Novosphingobium resinovorum]